ncbi:MAG: hypothetical protein N2596_04030 [Syntrophorhabdaceae bacterium]|nr:hypothetical protein [Syntrophorhabdaceae bacterium]
MSLYAEILDMIILSKIIEKRKNSFSGQSRTNGINFESLLKTSMEKITLQKNECKKDINDPFFSHQIHNYHLDGDINFEIALDFVLKHEGEKLVKQDGLKNESSKFGILQTTAYNYGYKGDIKDLTKEQARVIYKKIWDKSGASGLPYPLSLVYFDTYVNSPAMAKKLLEKSGGDIVKFLNMREQRYIRLSEKRPDIFGNYLKGWKNRINNLRAMVIDKRPFDAKMA